MSAPTGPQPSIHTPDTRMQPFLGASPGASIAAFRRGLQSVGAEDNTFLLFSDLGGLSIGDIPPSSGTEPGA
jgi:hypothetical protein